MSSISAPLATLLAALIGGYLLLYIHRKNARRTATAKYRAALLEAFTGLYPIPTNWPNNIDAHLRGIFPSLQRAIAEYRPYVPWHARKAYDQAWFIYRLDRDGREIDKQLYFHYMGFSSPGGPVIDPKVTFRSNVDSLLRFAGET